MRRREKLRRIDERIRARRRAMAWRRRPVARWLIGATPFGEELAGRPWLMVASFAFAYGFCVPAVVLALAAAGRFGEYVAQVTGWVG